MQPKHTCRNQQSEINFIHIFQPLSIFSRLQKQNAEQSDFSDSALRLCVRINFIFNFTLVRWNYKGFLALRAEQREPLQNSILLDLRSVFCDIRCTESNVIHRYSSFFTRPGFYKQHHGTKFGRQLICIYFWHGIQINYWQVMLLGYSTHHYLMNNLLINLYRSI